VGAVREGFVNPWWAIRIALLASCGPVGLAAQSAPLRLDGRRLPLQVDTYAVYVIRGRDTSRSGILVDALMTDSVRLVRVYDQRDLILGRQTDTIVSRLEDLAPIAYHDHSIHRIANLAFAGGRVDGWTRLPNGDTVGVHVLLPTSVYDGTSYDLVVRSAELRDSLQLTVPAFLVGSNTVGEIDGRVAGSATVDGMDCWVFRANFTGMPVTLWIDKRTRALRRQLMQVTDNIGILFKSLRS
jgi:hypothetical protein